MDIDLYVLVCTFIIYMYQGVFFFAFYGAYAGGKGGENGSKLKLYRFLDA